MIKTMTDQRPASGWTFDTFAEYVLALIREHDRRYSESKAATEISIKKAEELLSIKLATMNEFRETLRDQASTFASRKEIETTASKLEQRQDLIQGGIELRIKALEVARANMEGRMWAIGAGVIVINLVIVVAGSLIDIATRIFLVK